MMIQFDTIRMDPDRTHSHVVIVNEISSLWTDPHSFIII